MPETSPFEFAPAGILRVASWPLEAITQLDAPALAAQAQGVEAESGLELDSEGQAFDAAYAEHIEQARAKLWATTAACPRFRAALALSSPALHRRLGAGELPLRRNKSARHLETSLYRYLARAATRIEPFGLWTGVTLAHVDSGTAASTRCEAHPERVRLAPELGPFRALLLALCEQEPYRERGPWRLNPTLAADTAGSWRYARRDPSTGSLRWTTLSAGLAQPLSRALADVSGSLEQLRARVQMVAGSELAAELIELALAGGLLVGGLDLPLRYGDAWEALGLAEALLMDEHATHWARALTAARGLCDRLQHRLEAGSEQAAPAALGDAIVEVEAGLAGLVGELARALGLAEPPAPRSWLRCDLGAPWTLHLDSSERAQLRDLGAAWVELEREHERAAGRSARVHALLQSLCGGRLMAEEVPPPRMDAGRIEQGTQATDPDAGPPLGALILRPGAEGLSSGWLRGLSAVPTATHARHAYHLAELGDPLLPWFQAQFAALAQCGHEPVDLGYTHAGSPNLLARPCYVASVRGPWSAQAGAMLERDATLIAGPRPGALLVDTRSGTISLHAFTATVVPAGDPIIARLTLSSFDRRSHSASANTHAPPARAAKARSAQLCGLTMAPRRVELNAAQVASLVSVRHLTRYLAWLALARDCELPELVRVQLGGRPGLVIPTRSPLAVQAAFEGLRPGEGVSIEVVIERGFVPSPGGKHVAELVLPLRRINHLWRAPACEELRHAL